MEKIEKLREAVRKSLLEWKDFITPRIAPEDQKLEAKGNRIEQLLNDKATAEKILEEACLGAFSRFPTEAERAKLLAILSPSASNPANVRSVVEDLYWAFLSSKEFLFNH